jgi:hypothetical protein
MDLFILVTALWILTIVAITIVGRFAERFWIKIWQKIYHTTRNIRTYETIISAFSTLSIVLIAYIVGNVDGIVIVTLFYATVLFFTNILQAERPFPVIAFENRYYGDGYGSGDEDGFQYEFGLRNNGTEKMVDPTVEYRLYEPDFTPNPNLPDDWIEHSLTNRSNLTLEPGDHRRFEIEHGPIEHDGNTDYYLVIKITPRIQYSEMTLLFTREIAAEN